MQVDELNLTLAVDGGFVGPMVCSGGAKGMGFLGTGETPLEFCRMERMVLDRGEPFMSHTIEDARY